MTEELQQEVDKRINIVAKTTARMMVVGFCYNKILMGKTASSEEILSLYSDNTIYNSNEKYFHKLIESISLHYPESQITIEKFLVKFHNLESLNKMVRAILTTAFCEITEFNKIPVKVIINEYTNISASFLDASLTGFVNAMLEKMINK
jgi:transcription antitermination factor NusB